MGNRHLCARMENMNVCLRPCNIEIEVSCKLFKVRAILGSSKLAWYGEFQLEYSVVAGAQLLMATF